MQRPVLIALLAAFGFAGTVAATAGQARDLTLSEAEQLASRSNREVIAAQRAVESAGAGILQANVRPNPVLSYNASGIGNNPGIGAGITAFNSLPVEAFPDVTDTKVTVITLFVLPVLYVIFSKVRGRTRGGSPAAAHSEAQREAPKEG